MLEDETQLKTWFGCFVTSLDQQAEQQLSLSLDDEESGEISDFINELKTKTVLMRDPICRFSYIDTNSLQLFINGCAWNIEQVTPELVKYIANTRVVSIPVLLPHLANEDNQLFIYELWKLQWLSWD